MANIEHVMPFNCTNMKAGINEVLWQRERKINLLTAECDVPFPGIHVSGNFSFSLMVSEKFGTTVEKATRTSWDVNTLPQLLALMILQQFRSSETHHSVIWSNSCGVT